MSSQPRFSLYATLTTLALVLGSAGCRSFTEPGSASFASVIIQNHSAEEIAAATAKVFAADGYNGGMSGPGKMVFNKDASKATSVSREGVVGAHYGAQTINRVRVDVVPLADGSHRLQCKAFMVSGGSDPFFQDEVPLSNVRRGPYQSLLNDVAKQLK